MESKPLNIVDQRQYEEKLTDVAMNVWKLKWPSHWSDIIAEICKPMCIINSKLLSIANTIVFEALSKYSGIFVFEQRRYILRINDGRIELENIIAIVEIIEM